ncbi:D-alanyl-D-alanine carboxypeptidase/D-alanyl-D-alanine-endopeptidase [Psychrobacter sp. I-STPA10]|uniref:D-alanyl-D-alanine carboxypeptidase/D-alanyl-D-alanine-endopeptidase n=1 Tax=Psychrobacter sp. I-STPA10 TaxID=2585769 RepID=UPI001E4C077B|nr:D-alanyl-D-alanine carboxypeptidase [Psychrobacter sp. I-STPA10]
MTTLSVLLTTYYRQTLLTMSVLLSAPLCQAALPNMIEQSLIAANLKDNDISMVILPVSDDTQHNHLPAAILPKNPANTLPTDVTTVSMTENKQTEQTLTQPVTLEDGSVIQPIFKESAPLLVQDNELSMVDANPQPAIQPLTTPLYHLANQPRTPASTMKLIPTFVALDTLGQDFVWQTQILHTGVIINGTLYGDMIIKGSGDPKLTHERLTQLLYQAKKAGISHIDGNIILDTSIFQQVGKDPAAFDNEPLRPYNASPDGLLINFNSIQITTLPDNHGNSQLSYTPMLADYQLPATLPQRHASCGSIEYSLAPKWQTNQLSFNKNMPSNCGEHQFYIAYPDVTDYARRVVKQKWLDLGNSLNGQVITHNQLTATHSANVHSTKPKNSPPIVALKAWQYPLPLASYPSLPLSAQIYDINHYSNNVMTEQLTLSLPVYSANKTTLTSNYPTALTQISDWWQTHLSSPPPMMSNGSGLCRDCTVTAANMAELLQYAYQHPKFATYVDSLGIAGVSGTIAGHAHRRPHSQAIGRAWIKTGTLDNVTSMAGYVKGLSGQDYVVVGIINTNHKLNAAKARPVLDAMLDWTAQH